MNFKEVLKLERIVFYDGDCGFCNTSVQFVLNHRKKDFYFIPLQAEIAKEIMDKFDEKIEMNTLYLLKNKSLYSKSTAALKIAKSLKGVYPVLYYVGIIFPRFFRDWVYDQIAKRRHKINPGYCAMPSSEEKSFFIK